MQLRELFDEIPVASTTVIPLALEQLLREPIDVYGDWQRAEKLLLAAKSLFPDRPEISVALYKMYAYASLFEQSQALIGEVLHYCAHQGGFDPDWRELDAGSAPWENACGVFRLYLYTMKARGFVLLRQGEVVAALQVLNKLMELDAADQVGGSVVQDMALRILDDLEDDVA